MKALLVVSLSFALLAPVPAIRFDWQNRVY